LLFWVLDLVLSFGTGEATWPRLVLCRVGVSWSDLRSYALSENPRSPHSGDQTELFSERKWLPIAFTRRQLAQDPSLRRYTVRARR